jgi:hypothetical protein
MLGEAFENRPDFDKTTHQLEALIARNGNFVHLFQNDLRKIGEF